ncbi:PAS domain S-box protein [Shewanella frigidimarina]|uniref:PAS domain-containing protein n=1 Tax=Shewanella frigidimarina TaxID=56812 RepID=UPI000F5076F7|nr:PAS domain-containing protein [Shewanella frigidimarina]RPA61528.1 PAS domain S-box protein [Shewanella frigidimarina]
MQTPVFPLSETERLTALNNTGLLDTGPEERFDRLTHLAQLCLGTEIVLISLVDSNRQWFKSKQGLDACETSRDISFCGHTILGDSIFEVADALLDSRFADNPLVVSAPFIRFYAGVPLVCNGENIGTLCFIDSKPRQFTDKERDIAYGFAKSIEQEIIDRLQEQAHEQLTASELMYRSVLEGTRVGTWQWNVQTGDIVLNERWAEIIGYTLAELEPISNETWAARIHPDDNIKSSTSLQEHFNDENPFYDFKCRMKHKDGHYVWIHDKGRVISKTSNGKPLMMYGTRADITKQKNNELDLLQSRDQFKTLVANIPGVTYRCNPDKKWTMLFMSDYIYSLSGYPASEFTDNYSRSYVNIIHPEDRALLDKIVQESLLNQTSWVFNYRIVHKNGSVKWVEERGSAEYDSAGNVQFLNGFIQDVSKQKKLQDQLLKLTQQLPGVVYQYQLWPDGRSAFPYASSGIEDIYGVKPEDVVTDASNAFSTIYPEDVPAVSQSIELSSQQLTIWEQEYRVYRNDKSIIWLSGRATPERMPDGSTLWHGYIHDITQTKEYYLQLEDLNLQLNVTQQSLDLASEQAKIGYWHASFEHGTFWWSPIIYQIFGFNAEDVVPSSSLFKNSVHPDDIDKVLKSEQQTRSTGIVNEVYRIIRPNGEVRWVHELGQLVNKELNPDKIMIGSVQDITERMTLQKIKDEFISTVSHELRTPLTSIYGALSLLQSGKIATLPAKAEKLVEVASSNCKQLSRLINDLLDIEKLAAGKMLFEMKRLNVVPLLQRAINDHQPFADLHKITLTLHVDKQIDELFVYVDEHRLLQILTNFLSNAVKFSPESGSVMLSATLTADEIEIAVQDQGTGIPEDFKSKIFGKFSQADASSSKVKGGTGLGLALCKNLIEAMNGSIDYSSEPGCGARFFVRLPLSV